MFARVERLKRPGSHNPAQIALNERDVDALHGDVRAGAHGNSDICLGQGRSVVNAIARLGHDAPSLLQLFDRLDFLVWKDTRQSLHQCRG